MLATAIIVFREVLEAALVVSVVLAATQGVRHRLAFVGGGIGLGIILSLIMAFFTQSVSDAFDGVGQEIFSAVVLFTVVGLLAWHIVWMQSHGRALAQDMREVGAAVRTGEKPLIVLSAVVAFAVLREGVEIVLFMHGMLAAQSAVEIIAGFFAGLVGGLIVGAVLYWGFLKLPVGKLFTVTNFVLMLIAAGMAARGAGKLIQADFLPALQDPLWDTSAILSEKSMLGEFLAALIGYMDQPSAMQIVFYGVTIGGIILLTKLQKKGQKMQKNAA